MVTGKGKIRTTLASSNWRKYLALKLFVIAYWSGSQVLCRLLVGWGAGPAHRRTTLTPIVQRRAGASPAPYVHQPEDGFKSNLPTTNDSQGLLNRWRIRFPRRGATPRARCAESGRGRIWHHIAAQ